MNLDLVYKSKWEYEFSVFVRKNNLKRFFYNRRSFDLIYFITNDFYGLNKNLPIDKKIFKINLNYFITKLLVKKYKLKFDPELRNSNVEYLFLKI